MKKTLLLFVSAFPYNSSEAFLNPEYPLYKEFYDHIVIVTSRKKNEQITRNIDANFFTILDDLTYSLNLRELIKAFSLAIVDRQLYKEIGLLLRKRKFSIQKFKDLFITSARGNYRARLVYKWMKNHSDYKIKTIYSYWFNLTAYAAIKAKEKYLSEAKVVARAHGYDLYAERYKTNYPPFQEYIFKKVDYIAPISQNGKTYLEQKYGVDDKIHVWHLGAMVNGKKGPEDSRIIFKIVSCSRVVSVKRLHLIVDTLKIIDDVMIEWTHFGDGNMFAQLEKQIQDCPKNIKINLMGAMSNHEIYKKYEENPYHLFVNTSESEGISVAIMEAMSFGIPTVATDVGGTSELIEDNVNGKLIPVDFDITFLKSVIYEYIRMEEQEYQEQRKQARKKINEYFDAKTNSFKFLEEISKLVI